MEIAFSMNYLSWMKDRIVFLFMLFIFLHHATRTAVIPFKEDTCGLPQKLRNQFSEFRPEHSAEEYEFHSEKGASLTFELSFCTLSRKAIIAKMKNIVNHQTLFIQILDGPLALSIEQSETSQPECEYYFGDKVVNDGSLHSIEVGISPVMLRAQTYHLYRPLGNGKSVNCSHCVTNGMFLSGDYVIELGGDIVERFQNNKVQVLYSFVGCISNVRLNRRPIEKEAKKVASSDIGNECLTFQESCVDICPPPSEFVDRYCVCPVGNKLDNNNVCSPTCDCEKCQNGGTCFTTASSGPQCACPNGYSGSRCELMLLEFCDGMTCFNGSCETDNDTNSFKCICYPGFTGLSCNESVDACFGVLCKNGGTCHSNPTNLSECKCPTGYSGKYCDEDKMMKKDEKQLPLLEICFGIIGFLIVVLVVLVVWIVVLKRNSRPPAREGTPTEESSFIIPETKEPALIETEETDINENETISGISISKECEGNNLKNSEETTSHDEIPNINHQQHWDDKDATPSVTSKSCDNEQTTNEEEDIVRVNSDTMNVGDTVNSDTENNQDSISSHTDKDEVCASLNRDKDGIRVNAETENDEVSVNPETGSDGARINLETENDGLSVNTETENDGVSVNPETNTDGVSVNSDKYRISVNSGADKSGGSVNSETDERGTSINSETDKDGSSVNSDTYKYRIIVNPHTDKDGVSENSVTDKDGNCVSSDTNKGGVSVNSDMDNNGEANVQLQNTDELHNDTGSIHMDTREEKEHHESAELEYDTISTESDNLKENDSSEDHTSNNEYNDNFDDLSHYDEIFI